MDNHIYYEKRILAFVDIMGFKEKVAQSLDDEKAAKKVHRALKRILQIREDNDRYEKMGFNVSDIRITTFSDSAVISYPLSEGSGNLFGLLLDLIHLQIDLYQYDVLLRGGVTIGDAYHDGDIVYGPAMNKAYLLESKYAKVPRIIIDGGKILQGIRDTCPPYHNFEDEKEYMTSLLRQDSDGFWYLDSLKQFQELDYPELDYYNILWTVRSMIVSNMNHESKKVRKKYKWLRKYFNHVIKEEAHPLIDGLSVEESRKAYKGLLVKK